MEMIMWFLTIQLDLVENVAEIITVLEEKDVFWGEENTCKFSDKILKYLLHKIFLVAPQYSATMTRIVRMVGGVSEKNVGEEEEINHSHVFQ